MEKPLLSGRENATDEKSANRKRRMDFAVRRSNRIARRRAGDFSVDEIRRSRTGAARRKT